MLKKQQQSRLFSRAMAIVAVFVAFNLALANRAEANYLYYNADTQLNSFNKSVYVPALYFGATNGIFSYYNGTVGSYVNPANDTFSIFDNGSAAQNLRVWKGGSDYLGINNNSIQRYNNQALFINPSGGNVGIGTTTASTKLYVNGGTGDSINVNGGYVMGLNSTPVNADQAVPLGYLQANYNSSSTSFWDGSKAGNIWSNNSGNVGVGTTNPGAKLEVFGAPSTGIAMLLKGDINYGSVISYSRAGLYNWVAGIGGGSATNGIPISAYGISEGTTPRFIIGVGGNVGIGTTNPLRKLQVNGQSQFDNSNTYTNYSWTGSTLQTNSIEIMDKVGGSTSDGVYPTLVFHDYGNGGAQFSMEGSSKILHLASGNSNSAGTLQTGGTYFSKLKIWGGLETVGTTSLAITYGNVGIGTTSPGAKLDVVGGQIRGNYGLNVTGPSSINTGLTISDEGSFKRIQSFESELLAINPLGNNVAIGTTTANTRLYVNGGTGNSINVNGGYVMGLNSTPVNADQAVPLGYLQANYAPTSTIAANSFWSGSLTGNVYNANTGNIGIGVTNPATLLDLGGGINYTNINETYQMSSSTAKIIQVRDVAQSSLNLVSDTDSNGSVIGSISFSRSQGQTDAHRNVAGLRAIQTNGGGGTANRGGQLEFWTKQNGGPSVKMVINEGGNVGIGTTTPGNKLTVNSSALAFSGTPALAGTADGITGGGGTLYLETGGVSRLFINSSGDVGIGTTNPSSKLQIEQGSRFALRVGDTTTPANDAGLYLRTTGLGTIRTMSGRLGLYTDSDSVDGTKGITINGSNVGIGITNPSNKLGFSASTTEAKIGLNGGYVRGLTIIPIDDTDAVSRKYLHDNFAPIGINSSAFIQNGNSFGTTATLGTNDNNHLNFETNNATRMTIYNNGNVGIGTTNPTTKLAIDGSSQGLSIGKGTLVNGNRPGIDIYGYDNNQQHSLSLYSNYDDSKRTSDISTGQYVQQLKIDTSAGNSNIIINPGTGNVGIGTTSPTTKLDVVGSIRTSGQLISTVANGTAPLAVTSATLVSNLNADLLDGIDSTRIHYLNSTAGEILDANTITAAARIYRTTGGGSNFPVATNNAGILQNFIAYDTNYGYQIFSQTNVGNLYWRTKSTGTWGSWKTIYDSGNLTNSLTANYHAKWNGSSLVNGVVYDNGINIGIGITNPSNKLGFNASTTEAKIGLNGGYVRGLTITPIDDTDAVSRKYLHDNFASAGAAGNVFGTGTASYLPKWTATHTLANSLIYDNGTNLGIGTTSPSSKLSVVGDINVTSGNIYSETYRSSRSDGDIYIQAKTASDFISIGTEVAQNLLRVQGDGNVGIGTSTPVAKLGVFGSGRVINIGGGRIGGMDYTPLYDDEAVSLKYLRDNYTSTSTIASGSFWGGSLTGNVYNVNSGNVGIGTTSPGALLDVSGVAGNGVIHAFKTGTGGVLIGYGGNDIQGRTSTDANGDLILNRYGGNVGIGTSTPGAKLDVYYGTTRLWHSTGAYTQFNANELNHYTSTGGANTLYIQYPGGNWHTNIGHGALFIQGNNGNVGIGTTSPAYKLDVIGNGLRIRNTGDGSGIYLKPGANSSSPNLIGNGGNSSEETAIYGAGNVSINIDSNNNGTNGFYIRQNAESGGTTLFSLGEDNTAYFNGPNVGIGITNPSYKLAFNASTTEAKIGLNGGYVRGLTITPIDDTDAVSRKYLHDNFAPISINSNAFVQNGNSFGTTATLGTNDNNHLNFETNSTTRMTIYNNGNVGIGITNPSYKLQVNGNSYISGELYNLYGKAIKRGNDATIATDGWYRIAQTSGDRASGMFNVMDMTSSRHQSIFLYASAAYASGGNNYQLSLNILSNNFHGTQAFTKFRLVRGSTYDPVYLEVYVANVASNSVRYILSDNNWDSGWTPVDWTAGSIPSGYTAIEYSSDNISMNVSNNMLLNNYGTMSIGTTTATSSSRLFLQPAGGSTSNVINVNGAAIGGLDLTPINSDQAVPLGYLQNNFTSTSTIAATSFWGGSLTGNVYSKNTGNVGVGTTNPTVNFQISRAGNGEAVRIQNSSEGISYAGLFISPPSWNNGSTAIPAWIRSYSNAGLELFSNTTGGGANNPKLSLVSSDSIRFSFSTTNTTNPTDANWSEKMRINSAGNVGIGTTNPNGKLEIQSNVPGGELLTRIRNFSTTDNSYATLLLQATTADSYSGGGLRVYRGPNPRMEIVMDSDSGWTSTEGITIQDGGNVGIGTTSPAYKLDVVGSVNASSYSIGAKAYLENNGTEGVLRLRNGSNWGFIARGYSNSPVIGAHAGGSLNIGGFSAIDGSAYTTTATFDFTTKNLGIASTTPKAKLAISSSTAVVINVGGGRVGGLDYTPVNDDEAVPLAYLKNNYAAGDKWSKGGDTMANTLTLGTKNYYPLPFITNDTERMRLTEGGNLVIGTTTASVRLHVESPAGPVAYFSSRINNGNYSGYIGNGQSYSLDEFGLYEAFSGKALAAYDTASALLNYGGALFIDSTSHVGIGTSNPGTASLKVVGDAVVTGTLSTQTGSDFAEEFRSAGELEPGTVVVMGDLGYKSVKASGGAYDKTVVGIVSDNPSIIAGHIKTTAKENKVVVAMSGVVSVKVTATGGRIERGDLLTTSSISGQAMKAKDYRSGTIIGKALEDLEGKSGVIKVLVNLQ